MLMAAPDSVTLDVLLLPAGLPEMKLPVPVIPPEMVSVLPPPPLPTEKLAPPTKVIGPLNVNVGLPAV